MPQSPRFAFTARCIALCLAVGFGAAHADEPSTELDRLFHAGEYGALLDRADALLRTDPRNAQVRFIKGVALSELQRHADALRVFTALTQDFPELPEPYNNLAVLLTASGRLDEAREALQTALRFDAQYRQAQENLADVYALLAQRTLEQLNTGPRAGDASFQRKLTLARSMAQAVGEDASEARRPTLKR